MDKKNFHFMSKRTVPKEIIHIKKTLLSSKFIKDFTHLALKSKAAFQLLLMFRTSLNQLTKK